MIELKMAQFDSVRKGKEGETEERGGGETEKRGGGKLSWLKPSMKYE